MNLDSFQPPQSAEIDRERMNRLLEVSACAPRQLGRFERAYAGKSRKSAMDAMCSLCMGFDMKAVRECTDFSCPLWEYRSNQSEKGVVQ